MGVKIIEYPLNNGKVAIFKYVGDDDPVKHLDEAISLYTGKVKHTHLVDMDMKNPWVRIIISDIDEIQKGSTDFSEINKLLNIN